MTKEAFLAALREQLKMLYGSGWASDEAKLARFMSAVEETIHSPRNIWNMDGPATVAAWRQIGGKGKPTYKALRALPDK